MWSNEKEGEEWISRVLSRYDMEFEEKAVLVTGGTGGYCRRGETTGNRQINADGGPDLSLGFLACEDNALMGTEPIVLSNSRE